MNRLGEPGLFGQIRWDECFVDGSFAPAKKGGGRAWARQLWADDEQGEEFSISSGKIINSHSQVSDSGKHGHCARIWGILTSTQCRKEVVPLMEFPAKIAEFLGRNAA